MHCWTNLMSIAPANVLFSYTAKIGERNGPIKFLQWSDQSCNPKFVDPYQELSLRICNNSGFSSRNVTNAGLSLNPFLLEPK